MKSFEQGNEWLEDVALKLSEQICNEIDMQILQSILEESNKYYRFTHPPDYTITDQMILDWYKSLLEKLGIK